MGLSDANHVARGRQARRLRTAARATTSDERESVGYETCKRSRRESPARTAKETRTGKDQMTLDEQSESQVATWCPLLRGGADRPNSFAVGYPRRSLLGGRSPLSLRV